eukprot:10963797-Karenia_brevis.AAC.2
MPNSSARRRGAATFMTCFGHRAAKELANPHWTRCRGVGFSHINQSRAEDPTCLLYTSDAADDM